MAVVYCQKIDGETDGSERPHLMVDVRRNGLGRVAPKLDVERWFGRGGKSQLPVVYNDAAPGAPGDSMGVKQTRRHGVLIPFRAGTDKAEAVGQFGSVTKRTVERCPEPVVAPLVLLDPRSELEWRSVTDVLVVATGELGDPVALVVWVIASDGTLHKPSVAGIRYHCSADPGAKQAQTQQGLVGQKFTVIPEGLPPTPATVQRRPSESPGVSPTQTADEPNRVTRTS